MVLVFSIAFTALGGFCMSGCRLASLSFPWKILLTKLQVQKLKTATKNLEQQTGLITKSLGSSSSQIRLQGQAALARAQEMSHGWWTWTALLAPSAGTQVQKGYRALALRALLVPKSWFQSKQIACFPSSWYFFSKVIQGYAKLCKNFSL